ncbi:MAG: DUF4394 domain-containing protein [Gemmatimonadales bacterium]
MRRLVAYAFVPLTFGCAASDTTTDPAGDRAAPISTAAGGVPGQPAGTLIYGVDTDNNLITFAGEQANRQLSSAPITGLAVGERIVGIDFRPSDLNADGVDNIGRLYGVSSASKVYVIDPATGAASNGQALVTAAGAAVSLSGTTFGIGFNPVVDRLRIHADAEQNLAVNVDNGVTAVNTNLAYASGDPNFGADPSVTATAYTNSDTDPATGTQLFAIDASLDVLVLLATPANGQLATLGALGVNTGLVAGFDIVGTAAGTAYATLTDSPSGKPTLYTITLATGAATRLNLMAQSAPLVGIAIAP